eukprot:758653-Hanusia_phi.AAC.2
MRINDSTDAVNSDAFAFRFKDRNILLIGMYGGCATLQYKAALLFPSVLGNPREKDENRFAGENRSAAACRDLATVSSGG